MYELIYMGNCAMVSSSKRRTSSKKYYKKKVLLLGGLEQIKDRFQEEVSDTSLSLNNKHTIGVNISKITYNTQFDYYLWNISCGLERSFIRPMYYTGAEAVIVFISEENAQQIVPYYREITSRLPIVTVIFCILLNNKTQEEINDAYFTTKEFKLLFEEQDFEFNRISKGEHIFSQISSFFSKNLNENTFEDHFAINFIHLTNLLNSQENIQYLCEEYIEPEQTSSSLKRRLNTVALRRYLNRLNIPFKVEDSDWIILNNNKFGEFSIFLRNGDAYYTPQRCLDCNDPSCQRKNRVNNFVCIEANGKGWSNIEGFCQKELLVLSKILILQGSNENDLPQSILKQINRLKACIKEKA